MNTNQITVTLTETKATDIKVDVPFGWELSSFVPRPPQYGDYFLSSCGRQEPIACDSENVILPEIPILGKRRFIVKKLKTIYPKYGDTILVSNNGLEWVSRNFVAMHNGRYVTLGDCGGSNEHGELSTDVGAWVFAKSGEIEHARSVWQVGFNTRNRNVIQLEGTKGIRDIAQCDFAVEYDWNNRVLSVKKNRHGPSGKIDLTTLNRK